MTSSGSDKRLFWACFISLIATAFGFVIRTMIIADWGKEFGLTETQKGEIFGVGLWPFAISIVLFSLVIDRIGYGRAMIFAFVCHVLSAVITIFATGYWSLYIGTFICALANGTIEAVINPVVATVFAKEKTKWLNILHAGWPGGLVLGGLITLVMNSFAGGGGEGEAAAAATIGGLALWKCKVMLILLPTIAYGILMIGCKFPISERVSAGVSYKDMLKESGFAGAAIVVALIVWEVGRVIEAAGLQEGWFTAAAVASYASYVKIGVIGLITLAYGLYVQSIGRPMFVFLLLVMIPLATTELGTDSWITPLMETKMNENGLAGIWVLIYTSAIMMVLRFFAGPIVHRISPLGLLCGSSVIAAAGLVAISYSTTLGTIFLAATLYGLGKSFFWPTMLGVVAEQFPKGGALTLNTMGGVGMLGVGVIGASFLGYLQDSRVTTQLEAKDPEVYARVVSADEKTWVMSWATGPYKALDAAKLGAENAEKQAEVKSLTAEVQQSSLRTVAILPVIMFACFAALLGYFMSRGGYKPAEVGGGGHH
ncbi:major facilitator superfamily MFS_1 [Pirellula staleyi DSM 6068]|uniref:Major facilitator superfamily MFS_1 n=1 Tax=Pirellula staleyi (strain ATCC 27377 / DSM 6068 / ICPB 4128) TaxID=530564 RepID=D2R221_PIRSD|nr:MFS transporter [Pirellula staleyi]ADB18632.1 major facilitator superfamily MFS_1 [Pirellula staleyi DSM 6068]